MRIDLTQAFSMQFTKYRAGNVYQAMEAIARHHSHLLENPRGLGELVKIAEGIGVRTTVEELTEAIQDAIKNSKQTSTTKRTRRPAELIPLKGKGVEVPVQPLVRKPEPVEPVKSAPLRTLDAEPRAQASRARIVRPTLSASPKATAINNLPVFQTGDKFSLMDPNANKLAEKYIKPGDKCTMFYPHGGSEIVTFIGIKGDTIRDEYYEHCFVIQRDDNDFTDSFPIPYDYDVKVQILDQAPPAHIQTELKPGDKISLKTPDSKELIEKHLKLGDKCKVSFGDSTKVVTFQGIRKRHPDSKNYEFHFTGENNQTHWFPIPFPATIELMDQAILTPVQIEFDDEIPRRFYFPEDAKKLKPNEIWCNGTTIYNGRLEVGKTYNVFTTSNLITPRLEQVTLTNIFTFGPAETLFTFKGLDKTINSLDYAGGLIFIESNK